jgi:hypothetical protein
VDIDVGLNMCVHTNISTYMCAGRINEYYGRIPGSQCLLRLGATKFTTVNDLPLFGEAL